MKRNRSVVGVMLILWAAIIGCASPSEPVSEEQEYTDRYVSGLSSLTVRGYGEWTGTNAILELTYESQKHLQSITIDFAKWSKSPDLATSDFLSSLDRKLVDGALQTLASLNATAGANVSPFRHFQHRLLVLSSSSAVPADCYCYQCRDHHPAPCIKEDTVPEQLPVQSVKHEHTHGTIDSGLLSAASDCYCYQCRDHHPAPCVKDVEEAPMLTVKHEHTHGTVEGGLLSASSDCYCYQCRDHHPAPCLKDVEEAPMLTVKHEHTHGVVENSLISPASDCYCYQCRDHHPAPCIKNEEEAPM